jgi:hypothetical protein
VRFTACQKGSQIGYEVSTVGNRFNFLDSRNGKIGEIICVCPILEIDMQFEEAWQGYDRESDILCHLQERKGLERRRRREFVYPLRPR